MTISARSTPTPQKLAQPDRPSSKSSTRCCSPPLAKKPSKPEGHEGWDDYAPFYDWENARTFGRRDVAFWRTLASKCGGEVLELGCGTGRIALPLARAGVTITGIDRSDAMLTIARQRVTRARLRRRI